MYKTKTFVIIQNKNIPYKKDIVEGGADDID